MKKKAQVWLAVLMLFSMTFLLGGCVSTVSYSTTSATTAAVETIEEDTKETEEDTNTIDTTELTVAEGKGFALSVSCGYGRYAKYGRDMGVQATIINHGEDFVGELWVLVPNNGSGSQSTLFKKEFAIAAGEEKKVEVAVPVLFSTGKLNVSIRDESEKERASVDVKVNVQGNTDVMYVGVLSDNYLDLSYFTDTKTKTFLMEAEDFPEDKKSLDMLDIIVINDFNTSIFNENQYQALKSFVEGGGSLVIGTGATGTKTLEGFNDDFITGTIGETYRVPLSLGSEAAAAEKEVLEVNLDNSTPGYVEGETVLMEEIRVGKGNIQLFTFDLGMANAEWNTKGKTILRTVIDNLSDAKKNQINSELNNDNFYLLRNCLEMASAENVPKVGKYAVVLVIYLILVGPLLYVVLKKLDKRNYTWVIVPGLAVVFSLVIYTLGTDTRLSKPYVQYLTFASVADGIESEELTFSLTAPYNNAYEVKVPAEYDVSLPVMNYYYDSYNSDQSNSEYDISVAYGAEATTLGIRNYGAFESAYFSAESIKEVEGFVESDISLKENANGEIIYTGTVTNRLGYDLQSGVLVIDKIYYLIGDIANGETKSIEECTSYVIYNRDTFWNTDLMAQAVGGDPWANGNNSDKLRQYYALEYKFTGNIASTAEENYLLGFTEDSSNPVIDALGLKNAGIKLVSAEVDVNRGLADNQIYMPYLDSKFVVLNGDYDRTYRYIHSETLELEVLFGADEKIVSLIYPKMGNAENDPAAPNYGYGFYGTINAFNYETGQYEVLFEGGKPEAETDLKAYLNEENVMRLMFDLDEDARNYYSISVPILSAVKEAK